MEEIEQRNRHNSGRSRHGSGLSWHEPSKVRHNSGDLRKRFDHEASPKIKAGRDGSPRLLPNGLVNGLIKDDERIALINGNSDNGFVESPEDSDGSGADKISIEAISTSLSPKKGPLSDSAENSTSHSSRDSGMHSDYSGGQAANSSDPKGKKSSDSEGDSDNPTNGCTDGEDDQQLLIRSTRHQPTSPWKPRSRHNSSSEGLRKRTRSRSESESSEVMMTGTGNISGVEPISESKTLHKSPARPSSTGSRRRKPSAKRNDDVSSVKEKRRGSHDCLNRSISPLSSTSRQRHKSMGDAGLESSDSSRMIRSLDNPSYVHKNSDGANVLSSPSSPNRHTPLASSMPQRQEKPDLPEDHSMDNCSALASPVTDDDTKKLIAPKPPGRPSPTPPNKLDLPRVYRPSEDPNPPVQVAEVIIQRDDSFSPRNHKDANHKLNGGHVQPAVGPRAAGVTVKNGNIWHLRALPGDKVELSNVNREVVSTGKLDEQLKSPDSVCESGATKEVWAKNKCQATVTLLILLFANLLNYMDRVTIAGVLMDIQDFYDISRSQAGLLQTVFICSYMIFSPIFGFLGDRYNRKLIMAVGIFCWSSITLAGSFIPRENFLVFLTMRALVGIGEASYSTIAPTIIADLFVKDMRTKALAVFYFAIPVGSGMGYIIGANVAHAMGGWQWSLRVTPGLGVLCVLAIIFLVREPPRGAAEGGTHLGNTTYLADLKYLGRNKSFVFSSLGFTCVAFVAGALSLWAPTFMYNSILVQAREESEASVAFKFGVITCIAGFVGVGVGSETARRLRKKSPRADPLVCAGGLMGSAPFLFLTIVFSKYNTILTWIMIFIGETLLCLNWAIVTDIVLYIVIPTRRSTAEAAQILASHLLGDAGSPYLIGLMADSVRVGLSDRSTMAADFLSLQWSLYGCCFVCVIGGAFFLATAFFIEEDRARAEKAVRGSTSIQREEGNDDDSDDAMITGVVHTDHLNHVVA